MKILAISVHPDDETLGCGGTLLKHAAQGHSLHWLLVTAACEPGYSREQAAVQAAQVKEVEHAYPFKSLDWLKLPTTRLETLPLNDLIQAIHGIVEPLCPEIVFVPHRADVHSDHRVVFYAAQAVLKSFRMRSLGVSRVLACEVPSETDAAPATAENAFLPNVFEDISATLERKLEIMNLYRTEVQPEPLPRSPSAIRALGRIRGAAVGVKYAEAFMLIREVS